MTAKYFGPGSESPRIWEPGTNLPKIDQGVALVLWRDKRYTMHSTPRWAEIAESRGQDCPPQFVDDMDWLAHTSFSVTIAGNLDKRCKDCQEEPTWPTRPELRGLSLVAQARF